jgi:protein-disulfide isomerase
MDEPTLAATQLRQVRDAQNPWVLPGAILGAGLILAIATFVIRSHHLIAPVQGSVTAMRPISALTDHIVGNPGAGVVIVEYSDIDSPYAKQFQQSMEQLMADYAGGGKVAWVYRHFPLIDQHPNSEMHAEAAECVASLGDANSFWRFIDALNASAPDINQFDPKNYDAVVSTLGISTAKFDSCLSSHTFQQKVAADFGNALDSGASGAPFTVLLVKGQKPATIDGAIPYATLKQIVDQAVAKAAAAK